MFAEGNTTVPGGVNRALQESLYCRLQLLAVTLRKETGPLDIQPLSERIRDLCEKAKVAEGPEVEALLSELRMALQEHTQYVRFMTLMAHRSCAPTKASD